MVEWARSAWKDGPYKRIIREMQVKTTMKYYLIDMRYHPIQTATINKQNKAENNQCWWGCGEIGTCLHCWWESKLIRSLWTIGWRVLKKLKTKLLWKWSRSVFATPWTVAHQASLSMGILQARILEWFAMLSSREKYRAYLYLFFSSSFIEM